MDDNFHKADALIWSEQQIALLRARQFEQLDLENIIAELAHQVQSDKDEIASRLRRLMTYLLKYQFQPQRRSPSWISKIIEHRHGIVSILAQMPSLRAQIEDYVARIYPKTVAAAARETRTHPTNFPHENPYMLDQLLDHDFFPGETEEAIDSA